MFRIAFLVIVSISAFITAPSVYALGKSGHKIVCQLAYDLLPLDSKSNVNRIVSTLTKEQQTAINRYLGKAEVEEVTFAETCLWADAIKREEKFKQFNSWHYINVARDDLSVDADDCKTDCITRAILLHHQQITSNLSYKEKLKPLMFLGHWLGDIHQPMHVSYKSDWGGNKNKITSPDGQCTTLHWLWDSCIISRSVNDEAALMSQMATQLDRLVENYNPNLTAWDWATESLHIVRQPSVQYCQILDGNFCTSLASDKAMVLNENYEITHWPILKKRMLQASLRLSKLLQEI